MLKKRTKLYLTLFMAVILTATAVLALAQSTQSNKSKDPFESELDNELQTAITLNDEYMPQKKYTLIIGPNAALPEDPADSEETIDPATPSDAEDPDSGTSSDAKPATPTDIVKPSVQAWRCDVGDTHRLALKALKYYYKTDATYTLTYDSAWLELLGTDTQYSTGELTEISNEPGKLVFTFSKEIPEGQTWTGLIALLNFKILQTGTTEVILQLDKEQPLPIVPVTEGVNTPDANVNLVDADHRESVTASSIVSTYRSADKALDEDMTTRWTSGSELNPETLTVFFKDKYAFDHVYFLGDAASTAEYELQYLRLGTENGWETFHTGKTTGPVVIDTFGKIVTTAVRMVIHKTNDTAMAIIYELQVRYMSDPTAHEKDHVNEKNASINLVSEAYRQSVTVNSVSHPFYSVEKALDGDEGTRWMSSTEFNPEIMTIMFKDMYAFNHIYVYGDGTGMASYELQYRRPGTESGWETFYTGRTIGMVTLDNFGEIETTAVRMVMHKTSVTAQAVLREFQIRYVPDPPAPEKEHANEKDENINLAGEAYRQSAAVSSVYAPYYVVEKALDGDTATRWMSGDEFDPETMTVVFKDMYAFNNIYIRGAGIASYELQYRKPGTESGWETFYTGGALTTATIDNFGEIETTAVRIVMRKTNVAAAVSLYEFQIRYK